MYLNSVRGYYVLYLHRREYITNTMRKLGIESSKVIGKAKNLFNFDVGNSARKLS